MAEPTPRPVTTPLELTDATELLLLVHTPVPPVPVASTNVMVAPAQTAEGPVMEPADAADTTAME